MRRFLDKMDGNIVFVLSGIALSKKTSTVSKQYWARTKVLAWQPR